MPANVFDEKSEARSALPRNSMTDRLTLPANGDGSELERAEVYNPVDPTAQQPGAVSMSGEL